MRYVYVKKDGVVKKIEESILYSYLENKWVKANEEDYVKQKASPKASNKPTQSNK